MRVVRADLGALEGRMREDDHGWLIEVTAGNDGRWQNFDAVLWRGGVDVFLGAEGGRTWEVSPGSRQRVIFLRRCIGSAWGAFDLQRQVVERYGIAGPFRAILGIADTAGAMLGNVGAGWAEPGSPGAWGMPTAIEPHVMLLEDLAQWPDEKGVQELALRFGARVDLAFGGPGERHLDPRRAGDGEVHPAVVTQSEVCRTRRRSA
jgi:hypothetical protein